MPWGLFFVAVLSVIICFRRYPAGRLPVNRTLLLCLILALLILTYVDIPVGEKYLNLGGVFLLGCGITAGAVLYPAHAGRWGAAALIIAMLLFAEKSGLLWQLMQYLPTWLSPSLLLAMPLAACGGGWGEALIAAAIGTEASGLALLIFADSEMGLSGIDTFGKIAAGAWALIWFVRLFRRHTVD